MKKIVPLVIATIVLTSCSRYYPLPVSKPTKADYNSYKGNEENDIPYPTDFNSSKTYAWVYADHYRNKKMRFIDLFISIATGQWQEQLQR